ncbi:MAG: trypsin-like peptidase domain-containing protein [bacterium]|nr:trypsin-like peptidase domain-containing protein [bacterium]
MRKEKSPLITMIKKVMPAVVSIVISKNLEKLEQELTKEFPLFNSKTDIPEENIDSRGMVKIGGGSGFIVDEKGIVITNRHVVADADAEYMVVTSDNKKLKAEILARDPLNDVAILQITDSGKKFPTVKLGDSNEIELGQTVMAIGNALGLFKNTVSSGIVSGLSRSIAAQADVNSIQELRGLIQTDAAINPGNSGGPLVDIFGQTIGINVAVVFDAENIGFAIPINAAKRALEDLKKYGRIRRPFLGIRYLSIDQNLKEKLKLSVDYGALIAHEEHAIIPNSPADLAGIKEKDILLEINGEKITTDKPIQDFLENMAVNETIKLKVLRDEKEIDIKMTLAEKTIR